MLSRAACTAFLALLVSTPSLAVAPQPGDILMCDVSGNQSLTAYRPSTGSTQQVTPVNVLAVAVESANTVFVSTTGAIVYRLNVTTGALTPLTTGGFLSSNIDGLAMGRTGELYVTDLSDNQVIGVNVTTGAQRLVASGNLLVRPVGIAAVGFDSLLVSNDLNGKLIMVKISTGTQSVAASGGNIVRTAGVAIDFDGRAIVVDFDAKKLIAVNMSNGTQQVLASGITGSPYGLALDGLGNAYVGNYQPGTTGLTRIDMFTGVKTPITTPAMTVFNVALFSTGAAGGTPPPAPASFSASDDQPDGVHLSWDAVPEALTYHVYRNGQPIATVQPPTTTYLDSPTLGTYNYCVEAVNFAGPSGQVCDAGARRAYRSSPEVRIVRDVPNDQGGSIALAWLRSEFDATSGGTVTGYRVWRRLPLVESLRARSEVRPVTEGQAITFWEPLTTLPAAALEGYGVVVATTQDSLEDSNPYTAFFVSALTADPHVFYDSAVDSGYSVDNLAPAPPEGLHGTFDPQSGVTLHWMPNREADLARYRLYRGPSADFAPSPATFVGATADTVIADPASSGSYYKLSAVDLHGNESRPTTLAPADLPTMILVSDLQARVEGRRVRVLVSLARADDRYSALLYRGASDSFLEASILPIDPVVSTSPQIELIDETADPGKSYWYWVQLVGHDGTVVLAGPVQVEVGSAPAYTGISAAQPNPMRASTTLRFAVGTDAAGMGIAPCRIDVFNVQGRRVRSLVGDSRPAGNYEIAWDGADERGARARAGMYYVRLSVGSFQRSMKVVVTQ